MVLKKKGKKKQYGSIKGKAAECVFVARRLISVQRKKKGGGKKQYGSIKGKAGMCVRCAQAYQRSKKKRKHTVPEGVCVCMLPRYSSSKKEPHQREKTNRRQIVGL